MTKKRNVKINNLLIYLIFIFLILITILYVPFVGKIYPNIYVSGIYVGNKNKTEAVNILKQNFKIQDKFILNVNGKRNEILTSEIITSIDYEKTIDRAYNYGDLYTKLNLIFKPVNLYPNVTIDEDKLIEILSIASNSLNSKPEKPSIKKVNGDIIINLGKDGLEIDTIQTRKNILDALLFSKKTEVETKIITNKIKISETEALQYKLLAEKLIGKKITLKFDDIVITIDDDELISFLTPNGFSDELIKTKILDISRKINRNPQDSVFFVENGKVKEFVPSKDGVTVNESLLLSQIKNLPDVIDIPVVTVSPKIKNEDVNDLGIKTVLGKGSSNFKGSIPNRIHNVNLAQSKFKGILIPPNETVSFNSILGDVSGLTGYKAAYVIKDGRTVLGDGGGVCQVSTTLFRAVLAAGLPVIERRAHAYRVGYYEQGFPPGLDATVYSPTTDFKFKNNTSNHILIQPSINLENLALTFEIYGTNDGRVVSISKPVISSSISPASDVYIDDPSLKKGIIKQIEHRAYGAKVTFDYKVTRNGEELVNQKFISNYRPWQAVYLRGTAL